MAPPLNKYLELCRKHGLCITLALIAAGLAGNHFKFQIFLNIDFLFGSIFAMLVLQMFGTIRGIAAAALISAYTCLLWNHPYAIIIMTAEVAAVGWLMKRYRIGLVLADMIYWLSLGMPLVYIFYHLVMHTPTNTVYITMTKQAINGITNALIARLLFTACKLLSGTDRISYRELIYNLLAFFVLCPSLILLAVDSRMQFKETDQRIRSTLLMNRQLITNNLVTWAANRENVIVYLSQLAVSRSPLQMQPHLEQTKKSDFNFLRVGLIDKQATITAYFPLQDELGQHNIGKNFADRPYIPLLKQHLKPMLSEVVMGRVGIPQPIVSVLAPVIVNGGYNGYVIGVVDMNQVRTILEQGCSSRSSTYILLDKNDRVIMTNRSNQKVMTSFAREKGTLNMLEDGIQQWIPQLLPNTPVSERWKKSCYVAESRLGTETEWKLILEQPVAPFQKILYENYTDKLTILLIILSSALVLAEILSRTSIQTLENLQKTTSDLPNKLASGELIGWPESRIAETKHLIDNFKEMGSNIQHYISELDLLNKSLQQRVEERTEQLNHTLQELEIILDNAPVGISKVIDQKRVWVNNRFCEMSGYSKDELVSSCVSMLYPTEESVESLISGIIEVLEQGHVYETSQEMKTKDGSHIYVRCFGKAVNKDDMSLGILWIVEDISDKRKQEILEKELRMEKLHMLEIEKEQRHLKEKELLVKDLHDGIGGIISNISMLAQYGSMNASEIERNQVMQQIADLALEGTTEVRSFMNSMEEGEASWNNLLAEIRVHCSNMLTPHGIAFSFTTSISGHAPPPGILCYVNIIRVFRELTANIVKHSKASSVTVVFRAEYAHFLLEITDNGTGFDSAGIKRRGLANIASRCQVIGAVFNIASENGTCVRLELPLQHRI